MFHLLLLSELLPQPKCRVCGIELIYGKAKSCGNICSECHAWRQKEYYQTHKEECRQYVDPEKQKQASKKYYKEHYDKILLSQKVWREKNPERYRVNLRHNARIRDFRERKAPGSFTSQEWLNKLVKYDNSCVYCGIKPQIITCDHAIPISRGGSNTIENLVPACFHCNSQKHNKTADEFNKWRMEGKISTL